MRAWLATHSTEDMQIASIHELSARLEQETSRYATASLGDELIIEGEIADIGERLRAAMNALLAQPIRQMSEIRPRAEAVLRYIEAAGAGDDRAAIRTLAAIRDFLGGGDA